MNIFEMKSICTVFRNVLDMTSHMMFCSPSVGKTFQTVINVGNIKDRRLLMLLFSMDPDMDVTIYLTYRIFS
jgi:hypothetical protein